MILVIVMAVGMVMVGGWLWYLRAPSGESWDNMELVEKKSFWLHVARYNFVINGMSLSCNGVELSWSKWLDSDIWNGQGIDSVYIRAVVDSEEILIYPGELAFTSM